MKLLQLNLNMEILDPDSQPFHFFNLSSLEMVIRNFLVLVHKTYLFIFNYLQNHHIHSFSNETGSMTYLLNQMCLVPWVVAFDFLEMSLKFLYWSVACLVIFQPYYCLKNGLQLLAGPHYLRYYYECCLHCQLLPSFYCISPSSN